MIVKMIATVLAMACLTSATSDQIVRIRLDHADPALVMMLLTGKWVISPEISTYYNLNRGGGFGGFGGYNPGGR